MCQVSELEAYWRENQSGGGDGGREDSGISSTGSKQVQTRGPLDPRSTELAASFLGSSGGIDAEGRKYCS